MKARIKCTDDDKIRKELLEHCINRRDGKQVCVDASDYRRWADWLFRQAVENIPSVKSDKEISNEIIEFLKLPHPQFVGKRHQEEYIAWLEKKGEQKPVEWSKEDEAMRDFIIRIIEIQFPDGTFSAGEFKDIFKKDAIPVRMVIDWLKSLNPQDHCVDDKQQTGVTAWIARDKDGSLGIYKHSGKPRKWKDWWVNGVYLFHHIKESDLPSDINPQWEDEEPIEVEIKIEKIEKI